MEMTFHAVDDQELKAQLMHAATGDPKPAHDFFTQFDFNIYRNNGQHLLAYNRAIHLLQKLNTLDPNSYNSIHKGVPFYFTAMSAFLLHNYTHAVYFFDAAVSEDLRNDPGSRTPAIMFLEMDGKTEDQAALDLSKKAEQTLQYYLDMYAQSLLHSSISIEDVRRKFLTRAVKDRPQWRTLATSFISFILEMSHLSLLREIRPSEGTWEPFFIHLFKGCVLFESLLKANPTVPSQNNTLGKILKDERFKDRLQISRSLYTSCSNLADLLVNVPSPYHHIQDDLEYTARLRNSLGHNLGWQVSMTPTQYSILTEIVMNSTLHCIAALY